MSIAVLTPAQVDQCFRLACGYSYGTTRRKNDDPNNKNGLPGIQNTFQSDLVKMGANILLGCTDEFLLCNKPRSVAGGDVDHYDYRFTLADGSLMVMNVKSKCCRDDDIYDLNVDTDREVKFIETAIGSSSTSTQSTPIPECTRKVLKNAPGVQERVYALFKLSLTHEQLMHMTATLNSAYAVYATDPVDAEWAGRRAVLATELSGPNPVRVEFVGWKKSADMFTQRRRYIKHEVDWKTKKVKTYPTGDNKGKTMYSFKVPQDDLNTDLAALKTYLNGCAVPDLTYVKQAAAEAAAAASSSASSSWPRGRQSSSGTRYRQRPYQN
jgi:hypothetical protein